MKTEYVDINELILKISDLILREHKKQESLQILCRKEGVEDTKNICVAVYSKYLKRLFSFRLSLEKAHEITSTKKINQTEDEESRLNVLAHYLIQARFDFFVGIFHLFEDFISIILEQTLSRQDFFSLKPDIRKILENKQIETLIKENYSAEYKEIKQKENFVPLARKLTRIKGLSTEEKTEIEFFSCFRNILHSNGFYHGSDRDYEIYNKSFRSGKIFEFTMEEYFLWIERLFEITDKLCQAYYKDEVLDNTF